MKKRMKKVQALLLAGVMLLGVQTGVAHAATPTVGTGTEDQPATVSIQKDLIFADGITVPNATFKFTVTPVTQGAPTATIADVTYSNKDSKGTAQNGVFKISKNSAITFDSAFPHAGVYEYDVVEAANTYTSTGKDAVTYSTDKYRLRVFVENKKDGVFVETITAEKMSGGQTTGTKVSQILFENTYTKQADLVVKKVTAGQLADKTKAFDFKITLTKSPTAPADQTTVNATLSSDTTPQVVTYGTPYEFKLSDNQTLKFIDLPVGTTYVVEEVGAKDDYTPKVEVVENGASKQAQTATTEDANLVTGNTLVGETANSVTFTNTYKDTPITGIVMNNLPFVVMIGVAVFSFVAFLFTRRKRTNG